MSNAPTSPLAAIQRIFRTADRHIVRGQKSVWTRRIAQVCFAVALTVNLANITHDNGFVAEIVARTAGSEPALMTDESLGATLSQARWVALPVSPFLESGKSPDGSLDPERLWQAWQQAGLSMQDVPRILARLGPLMPVDMGVTDLSFERQLMGEAQAAADALAKDFPQAHAVLAQWQAGRESLVSSKEGPGISSEILLPPLNPSVKAREWEASRQALLEAVTESGLRAIHLTPEALLAPSQMQRLALQVTTANRELQQATGWHGPVLGLGGRLELTIHTTRLNVKADSSKEGRLRLESQTGQINGAWIQALDYVVAEHAFSKQIGWHFADQDGKWRAESMPRLARMWRAAPRLMMGPPLPCLPTPNQMASTKPNWPMPSRFTPPPSLQLGFQRN